MFLILIFKKKNVKIKQKYGDLKSIIIIKESYKWILQQDTKGMNLYHIPSLDCVFDVRSIYSKLSYYTSHARNLSPFYGNNTISALVLRQQQQLRFRGRGPKRCRAFLRCRRRSCGGVLACLFARAFLHVIYSSIGI